MSSTEVSRGYFIEVSVIQDSILSHNGKKIETVMDGTRVRVRRVTQKGDFTYEFDFPEGIVIAREDMDGTGELIHPEDIELVKQKIAHSAREIHPDTNSKAREELRAAIFKVLNTTPRPKSVGVRRGTKKEYRTIGSRSSQS